MLFAYDQVLIAKSESDLQYSVHNLNKIATKYILEINIEKTSNGFQRKRTSQEQNLYK
jgi:hypothetical protein